jgi:hypothetical protein
MTIPDNIPMESENSDEEMGHLTPYRMHGDQKIDLHSSDWRKAISCSLSSDITFGNKSEGRWMKTDHIEDRVGQKRSFMLQPRLNGKRFKSLRSAMKGLSIKIVKPTTTPSRFMR